VFICVHLWLKIVPSTFCRDGLTQSSRSDAGTARRLFRPAAAPFETMFQRRTEDRPSSEKGGQIWFRNRSKTASLQRNLRSVFWTLNSLELHEM
jgi:hypothetical protein